MKPRTSPAHLGRSTRQRTLAGATCVLLAALAVVAVEQRSAGAATSFTAGDLVIYRVGDGSSTLSSSSAAAFLDEYSPSGSLVRSISLPTATSGSNKALTASGSANSEGMITLSPNGQFLVATGYNAATGTSNIADTTAASKPRTVAIVGTSGSVDTSTALTDFSDGNNPRSATTVDGTHVWVGGAAGSVRYAAVGATTSTAVTSSTYKNVRQLSVYDNQLYTSADPSKASVTIAKIGSGLPTAGSLSPTNLPFSSAPSQPYAYSMLTLGTGSAPDTMYVADNSAGAIVKYVLSGSSWVTRGSVSVANVTGVTANDVNGTVSIFATSSGSNATAGTLYSIVDASGANGSMSGSANLIKTAPTKQAFRGVAFAPGTVIGSGGTSTPPSVPTISTAHTALPAALGDSTNPTLALTVGDSSYDPTQLTVTATSSSQSVAPAAGISMSGSGADRVLAITPATIGYSTITLKVTAPDASTATTTISYAVSANLGDASDRYFDGSGNLSTAIDVGDGYMLVADDENNILRLYQQSQSGEPVKTFDFTSQLPSGTAEVDIEASARAGNTIYWTGSMANSNDGDLAPERNSVFAATISGSGASTTLTYQGSCSGLRSDMINWDQTNGHGLGTNHLGLAASAASGVGGHDSDALDVEGLEFASGSTSTAYVTFRAPLQPTNNRHLALVVPVTNLDALTSHGNPGTTHATFGAPMFWDLGGHGIREIRKNADNQYLIIAGSADDSNSSFALYSWDGNPAHQPLLSPTALPLVPSGASQGSWESIVNVPDPLINGAPVQLIEDDGDAVWYNDGNTSKDGLPADIQKDLGRTFTFVAPVLPSSTTAIAASTTVSAIGQSITYTATVSGASGTPTGTVTFTDSGTPISTCSAVALSASQTATCAVTYPAAAQHLIKASYSGDAAFAASTSTVLTESIQPWTLTITADNQSIAFGDADPAFSFTAGGLMGSDTVTTPPHCTAAGVHTAVGAYPITCTGADAGPNYSIHYVAGTLTVTKATVIVTAEADNNPIVTGQSVTISTTVAANDTGVAPTGTVFFAGDGVALPGCGTVTLNAGTASCVIAGGLVAGSYPIQVTYQGDGSFLSGSSSPDLLILQVNPATTTTALTSDVANPVSGQAVDFTAAIAVTAPGSANPAQPNGTVDFQVDGVNLPGCGATTVLGAGVAVCHVPSGFLPPTQSITAAYSGNPNFAASVATPLAQNVTPDSTTVQVSASVEAPPVDVPVTFTALIVPDAPGGGAPSGTVTFTNSTGPIEGCAAVPVSTTAPYTATCTTTEPSPTSDTITASYSGDTPFAAAAGSHTITAVAGAAAAVVVSPQAASITAGAYQSYTVTGTDAHGNDLGDVSASAAFTITPDGSCTDHRCTAAIPGPHTVTATDGSASDIAILTVTTASNAQVSRDVIGVGDSLSQYGMDFLANGDPDGDPGFDTTPQTKQLISFDATADATGMALYSPDGTPLDPTVVLQPGTSPVLRPNSSRSAISALLADTDGTQIQFARSTQLPTAADQSAAGANGWGGLRVIRYATDKIEIAVDKAATNAPAGLSAAELVKIYDGTYQTWGQIPGYVGPAPDEPIVALLPAAGSDVRLAFDADLAAANEGVAVSYASSVGTVGENDYTAISDSASPANTIVPFSAGTISLIGTGYLGDTASAAVGGLSATAPDSSPSYSKAVQLYVIVRDSDVGAIAPWRSGSTVNWVHTLFLGPNSLAARISFASLLPAAGLTAAYEDLGDLVQ